MRCVKVEVEVRSAPGVNSTQTPDRLPVNYTKTEWVLIRVTVSIFELHRLLE